LSQRRPPISAARLRQPASWRAELIRDVGIDAKHSFEDTIESVVTAKETYGRDIALIGGIDVDFLCRASERQIRERVRAILEKCLAGGGYCLGTGNPPAGGRTTFRLITILPCWTRAGVGSPGETRAS